MDSYLIDIDNFKVIGKFNSALDADNFALNDGDYEYDVYDSPADLARYGNLDQLTDFYTKLTNSERCKFVSVKSCGIAIWNYLLSLNLAVKDGGDSDGGELSDLPNFDDEFQTNKEDVVKKKQSKAAPKKAAPKKAAPKKAAPKKAKGITINRKLTDKTKLKKTGILYRFQPNSVRRKCFQQLKDGSTVRAYVNACEKIGIPEIKSKAALNMMIYSRTVEVKK